MNRGIYPILSGALAQEKRMQVLANNLANVNTTAFKRDEPIFRSLLARSGSSAPFRSDGFMPPTPRRSLTAAERVFASVDGIKTDLEPARLRTTGNPQDIAIRGAGFFEIKTPQGTLYTRDGAFHVDPKRRLVTEAGYAVMGSKGELKLPPGDVTINPKGGISVNGQTVDTIKIIDFPDTAPPTKVGEGLFRGQSGTTVKDPTLAPGHLEESGVNGAR
jgi:flagellar basal-body rod protein FlgG